MRVFCRFGAPAHFGPMIASTTSVFASVSATYVLKSIAERNAVDVHEHRVGAVARRQPIANAAGDAVGILSPIR